MELLSLIVAAFSGVVAVVSVVFSIITYRKAVVHDRKQATLEAFNRLQTEAFDHINLMSPANIREICEDPKCETYKILSGYVARIEHFAVGVKQRIYDWKVVYELSHGFIDKSIRSRIDIVIDEKNKNSDTDYYRNIHELYIRMEKETNKR